MSNKNLTKTLFADFRKVDTKKLNINGNPFSKVVSDNVPETPTENDIWKYAATTDDKGVVTVTNDVAVDYFEITIAQEAITKTAVKVIDNKVLDANDAVLMNWDTKNFINENNSDMTSIFGGNYSQRAPITEWDSDLSSLTNGNSMFHSTGLQSFNSDLSSLANGTQMFYNSALTSFSINLPSLTNGSSMFGYSALTSFNGDLPSLTNGNGIFYGTALQSFNGDMPSLENGYQMFRYTDLQSFNDDLSSLTYGANMFQSTPLTSFSGDLSSLTNGERMFSQTALKSFNGDLSNLTNGKNMFCDTALESFNGDLSSLENGYRMFRYNQPRHYEITHYKKEDTTTPMIMETFVSNGLKSFISNLSSLENGYQMFGSGDDVEYTYTDDDGNEVTDTTIDVAPLDEESIMLIADTIKDVKGLDLTGDNDGQIWLGYDSSITDTTNIFKYCDEIVAKGWTVFLNGSEYPYESSESDSGALIDGESSTTSIPHYYKPVQVTNEDVAEYVDQNGNYYIIIGAQHVFGDDISTYGMFTSYKHAVSEITTALGLTPYEKLTEEPEI